MSCNVKKRAKTFFEKSLANYSRQGIFRSNKDTLSVVKPQINSDFEQWLGLS